jgi:hypothetical protein
LIVVVQADVEAHLVAVLELVAGVGILEEGLAEADFHFPAAFAFSADAVDVSFSGFSTS